MNEVRHATAAPAWYWAGTILVALFSISALALALFERVESVVAQWNQAYNRTPSWIYFATEWTCFVVQGVGAIGLLRRRTWAVPMMAAALASAVMWGLYCMAALGTDVLMIILVLVSLHVLPWVFAYIARSRGLLSSGA